MKKGIILAGGHGSRLYPLTKMFNKSLLPVYDKPMIYYPLETLKQIGCKEICVVSGKEHSGQIMNHLGSGSEFDVDITYRVQDKPGGIAQALGLCREFAGRDNIFVCLGDNIFEDNFSNLQQGLFTTEWIDSFCDEDPKNHIFLKKVPDPERFGVPSFYGVGQYLQEIEEKPEKPKSEYAVTGLYVFDFNVWNIIKTLKPSERGELEIVDVINWYVDRGKTSYSFVKGFWSDAGTPDSLVHANKLVSRSKND
jgi:glucose-1-phosphate thymidylyltransferase